MPYRVQGVKDLYDDAIEAGEGGFYAELVEEFLNKAERDGWRLVGTIAPHDAVFVPETDERAAFWHKGTAMMVLHKEPESQPGYIYSS